MLPPRCRWPWEFRGDSLAEFGGVYLGDVLQLARGLQGLWHANMVVGMVRTLNNPALQGKDKPKEQVRLGGTCWEPAGNHQCLAGS